VYCVHVSAYGLPTWPPQGRKRTNSELHNTYVHAESISILLLQAKPAFFEVVRFCDAGVSGKCAGKTREEMALNPIFCIPRCGLVYDAGDKWANHSQTRFLEDVSAPHKSARKLPPLFCSVLGSLRFTKTNVRQREGNLPCCTGEKITPAYALPVPSRFVPSSRHLIQDKNSRVTTALPSSGINTQDAFCQIRDEMHPVLPFVNDDAAGCDR